MSIQKSYRNTTTNSPSQYPSTSEDSISFIPVNATNIGSVISTSDTVSTYTNTNNTIYGDAIYTSLSKSITPRDIFDKIKAVAPEVVGTSGIDDTVFIEILNRQLALFCAPRNNRKWNFLTSEIAINLQPGIMEYDLPVNFDQMIAVWRELNSNINKGQTRRKELVYIDYTKKNFVSGVDYYTRFRNRIEFISLTGLMSDKIYLQYFSTPLLVKHMNDTIGWFPANMYALEYITEKVLEAIYPKAGQGMYVSPSAEALFGAVMSWDSNFSPVENKRQSDNRIFDTSRLHTKFSASRIRRY